MFWKFNLLTSHIENLLDKEDVTLQEILEEDDVLQECKAQNRKLIDFLVRPENIEELVNLVIQEPPDDTEEKARYKFPNTACELLTSDVAAIVNKLAGEEALLNKVYTFLESEGPLNPLLASFFSKVMGLLITRKSDVMLAFLQSKEDFVNQLLHHLGTSAIMDLLLRLITCMNSVEVCTQCSTWLDEQQLVQKLVQMIKHTESEEKHCNASQSLCDVIRLSREQMAQLQEKAENDPLLATIESQETVTELLNNMLNGEKDESVLISGLAVIQTLLEFRKMGFGLTMSGTDSEAMTALDAERFAAGVSTTLLALGPRLKDLCDILTSPPKQHYSVMSTTIGPLDPPLGNTRLQVVRLITSLLLTNTHSINVELAKLGTISTLLELYYRYTWNNFLHTQVEQCIGTILSNAPTEEDGKVESPLLDQLFTECNLIHKILDAWEDNDVNQSRPGGHRRGYMGHLTRIANHIADNMEKGNNSERIKQLFQELPEDAREKWENFISGTLAEVNKQNTVDLVGGHPLHSSSEDDDPDFREIPFPQDTAMQQFGFNEDEFALQGEKVELPFTDKISSITFEINTADENPTAASLFEQACSERMQQFDDEDSEEDLWEEKEITFAHTEQHRHGGVSAPTRAAPEDVNSDDSDNSEDSEEELDSPHQIHAVPPTSSEKMDIDHTEWQANFDDVPMEATPVAMDTQSSPWDTPAAPVENTEPESSAWAKFDDIPSTDAAKPNGQQEEWSEFSSFTSIESSNINSNEPVQRNSSPVEMDTAEASPSTPRTAVYMVSSAPADLATEVTSGDESSSSATSTPDSLDEANKNSSPSCSNENAMTTIAPSPESAASSEGTSIDLPNCTQPDMGGPELEPLPEQGEMTITPDNANITTECVSTAEEDDEDLNDNFNFLASTGLMKAISSEEKVTTNTDTPSINCDSHVKDPVEEARAQAKEVLEKYSAAASGGASTHNGPV